MDTEYFYWLRIIVFEHKSLRGNSAGIKDYYEKGMDVTKKHSLLYGVAVKVLKLSPHALAIR